MNLCQFAMKRLQPPRHSPDVNALLSIMLMLSGLAAVDLVADRIAIRKAIAANNFDGAEQGRFWSERTRPTVTVDSIRFLAPDNAIAEGRMNQYGSTIIVRRWSVRIAVRKNSGVWRVVSVESR